jgi:peptidase M1-like protein
VSRTILQAAAGVALAIVAMAIAQGQEAAPEPARMTVRPGDTGWASPITYELVARLDPKEHRVHGSGTITWRNVSAVEQREIWLHLYLNAFRDESTVFMRDEPSGFRGSGTPTEWGSIDVESLRARELDVDLWPNADKTSPDDPKDATDIRVPLPRAVAPGETLTLEVKWESKLPSVVLRTGFVGGFHMVAQWFPKLAKLEPDGRWVHFTFHRLSEFYADFGRYDVRIEVPEGFRVGATGKRVETSTKDGILTERYQAEPVHDFAFTAWDEFDETDRNEGGIAIRSLYPRGEESLAAIELDAAVEGLRHFGAAFGPYPYDTLTIVHPPAAASEAGGMEYPTLITTGRGVSVRLGARVLESVTLHELAHQWFYGLFASNEHEVPFLDEGLATYAEIDALEAFYGSGSALSLGGLRLSASAVARAVGTTAPLDVVAQPAPAFATGGDYGAMVYGRTAALLHTLRRVYGDEPMARAFRAYQKRARFAHPTPRDLFAAIAGELGEKATEVLRRGLYERGWVDYRVAELHGDRDKGGGSVLVRRLGTLELPVEVELVFEDQSRERVEWDGEGAHHRIVREGGSALAAVIVDPDVRVLVDDDLSNNLMSLRRRRIAPRVLGLGAAAAAILSSVVTP